MKIILILILVTSTYLNADIKQKMLKLYKEKNYKSACNIGYDNFHKFSKNEKLITLYAFSCLESDYIDRLSIPIVKLKYSQEARINSSFFSVILLQKKLLYHSLVDGYDISSLNFPTTKYALSKVFDLYSKLDSHEKKEFYTFRDENDTHITYKLFLDKSSQLPKMVIEEYYDTITKKRHVYW